MGRLEGKSAVVTGGGTGIGRAASQRFALEGARVVIAELSPDLGRETERLIRQAGGEATFVQTDVTDESQVEAVMASAMAAHDTIDVLYNCAGGSIASDGKVDEIDLDAVYDHTMSLDLRGTMLCTRYAVPHMIATGGGSIINMSSLAALSGVDMHVYSAAKGGVYSFTRSMAELLGKDGVTVNSVCPSLVEVKSMTDAMPPGMWEKVRDMVAARYPLGRVGQPDDIANAVLFLASDEAAFITGQNLEVSGGARL